MADKDDLDFLQLLEGEDASGQKAKQVVVPERIPITKGTLAKAYQICDAVKKIAGFSHEWFSFLLAKKSDSRYIVRDLLLVQGAKVQPGHVTVDGTMHAKAAAEIQKLNSEQKQDFYTIGWLHSHGAGTPYHSGEDEGNFEMLLNSVRFNTQHTVPRELTLIESTPLRSIEDDRIVISGKNLEDAILTYAMPDRDGFDELLAKYGLARTDEAMEVPRNEFLAALLDVMKFRVDESTIVGFGYSIVVNDRRDEPFASIGSVEERSITGHEKRKVLTRKTTVDVVEADDDVHADDASIEAMVKSRLVFAPRYVYHQPQYGVQSFIGRWAGKGRGRRIKGISVRLADGTRGILDSCDPRVAAFLQGSYPQRSVDPLDEIIGRHSGQPCDLPVPRDHFITSDLPFPGATSFEEVFFEGDDGRFAGETCWKEDRWKEKLLASDQDSAGGAYTHQSYADRPLQRVVDKKAPGELELSELVDLFTLNAAAYVRRFRSQDVLYSHYLDLVLHTVDYVHVGLRQAVLQTGKLEKDSDNVPEPKLKMYGLSMIASMILSGVRFVNNADLQIQFMAAFVMQDKNAAIEKYIPLFNPPMPCKL